VAEFLIAFGGLAFVFLACCLPSVYFCELMARCLVAHSRGLQAYRQTVRRPVVLPAIAADENASAAPAAS
jgi:hypothetical protein